MQLLAEVAGERVRLGEFQLEGTALPQLTGDALERLR